MSVKLKPKLKKLVARRGIKIKKEHRHHRDDDDLPDDDEGEGEQSRMKGWIKTVHKGGE
ncbi:MAG: hypothetical protein JWL87_417 [Candidatus Adlerbacteria bacterium]|nr:hypothetical protein [Candidatus Adlerbacteria bacterium]